MAVVVDPAGRGTAEQVRQGVRKAASALEDAGCAVDEVEPPSIDAAANALLVMLSTPGIRQGWRESMSPLAPVDTQRFMSAFFAAAGDPGARAAEQAFMTRQSVLRAWGEFQQTHPLIVVLICTEPPFEAGTDLQDGRRRPRRGRRGPAPRWGRCSAAGSRGG